MWEFIHTSARSGLQPHTSGFCPVAWTNGLPPHLIPLLEQLSAYRFLYPVSEDPEGCRTPVEYFYRRVQYGGRLWPIVGRIGGTKLDYTGRLNRIAHLLILEEPEIPSGPDGAVAICRAAANFRTTYEEPPRLLPLRVLQTAEPQPNKNIWGFFHLDPRWAEVIADHWLSTNGSEPFYCLFPPDIPAETRLHLVSSVIACLPETVRSKFTFSTYYAQNTAGGDCYFRCLAESGTVSLPKFHLSLSKPVPVPVQVAQQPNPANPAPPAAEKVYRPIRRENATIRIILPDSLTAPKAQPALPVAPPADKPSTRQRKSMLSEIQTATQKYPGNRIATVAIVLSLIAILLGAADLWQRRHPKEHPTPTQLSQKVDPFPPPTVRKNSISAVQSNVPKPPVATTPNVPPAQPKIVKDMPPQTVAAAKIVKHTPPPELQCTRYQVQLASDPAAGTLWSFRQISGPPNPTWQNRKINAGSYLKAVLREQKAQQRTSNAENALAEENIRAAQREKELSNPNNLTAHQLKELRRAQNRQETIFQDLKENLKKCRNNEKIFRQTRIQKAKELQQEIENGDGNLSNTLPTLYQLLQKGDLPTPETERRCEKELAAQSTHGGTIHAER